MITLCVEVMGK